MAGLVQIYLGHIPIAGPFANQEDAESALAYLDAKGIYRAIEYLTGAQLRYEYTRTERQPPIGAQVAEAVQADARHS